eukprot:2880284-Ditylum_brightwellii.AAC.1
MITPVPSLLLQPLSLDSSFEVALTDKDDILPLSFVKEYFDDSGLELKLSIKTITIPMSRRLLLVAKKKKQQITLVLVYSPAGTN